MNEIFASHDHAHPNIDDVTIASRTMDEHLQIDLPKAFALCSKYNILLKGKKADLAKDETRVLGFRVTQTNTSLSCEKVEKIKEMTFPESKKDCVSKVAFFSYFCQAARNYLNCLLHHGSWQSREIDFSRRKQIEQHLKR